MPRGNVFHIRADEVAIRNKVARSLAATMRANRLNSRHVAETVGCTPRTIQNALNEDVTLSALILARLLLAFPEFQWMPTDGSEVIARRKKVQAQAWAQREMLLPIRMAA